MNRAAGVVALALRAAGEIITTGTLTAAMPVRAGERCASGYDGIALAGIALAFVD